MKSLKKNWIFVSITLVSILLGVLAVLTAVKLRQETSIAPTAPQSKPKAVDGSPAPACQYQFSISLSASPSPTPTTTPGSSPQPTPTPSSTPRPTATPASTPTPTPAPKCGSVCTDASDCPTNMTCLVSSGQTSGVCRLAACQTASNCVCPTAANPSPNPTPLTIPTVPVAGTSWPTLFLIMGGVALLIIGFAL